jgi:hypothetical protein
MRLGALILISALLLVQFRLSLVQMDYLVNKEYIMKELCIEKDVEESTCDGKCYMKQKMDQVEEAQDSDGQSVPLRIQLEEIHFLSEAIALKEHLPGIMIHRESGILIPMVSTGFHAIDAPPPEFS